MADPPQRGVPHRHGRRATLNPFHGYKNDIDDQLEGAVAVLDAFHVIKLGTDAVDACRRRVQQDIHGHRGRKGDPLDGIRLILRCGRERLTDKQQARLDKAITPDERYDAVYVASQCAQQLRSAYTASSLAGCRKIAQRVVASFPTCPIPRDRAARPNTEAVGKNAFLAYFDTARANNGGTEAINGLIELHRRVAGGFRNRHNYLPRILLIGGGLDHQPHASKRSPVFARAIPHLDLDGYTSGTHDDRIAPITANASNVSQRRRLAVFVANRR